MHKLLHETEHDPSYDVPPIVIRAVMRGWLEDLSWHNDACPHFGVMAASGDHARIHLWVDHPERTKREFPELERFTVQVEDGSGVPDEVYAGDNAVHALMAVRAML